MRSGRFDLTDFRDGSSCYTYELQRNSEGQLERKPIEMRKLPHTEEVRKWKRKEKFLKQNDIQ